MYCYFILYLICCMLIQPWMWCREYIWMDMWHLTGLCNDKAWHWYDMSRPCVLLVRAGTASHGGPQTSLPRMRSEWWWAAAIFHMEGLCSVQSCPVTSNCKVELEHSDTLPLPPVSQWYHTIPYHQPHHHGNSPALACSDIMRYFICFYTEDLLGLVKADLCRYRFTSLFNRSLVELMIYFMPY